MTLRRAAVAILLSASAASAVLAAPVPKDQLMVPPPDAQHQFRADAGDGAVGGGRCQHFGVRHPEYACLFLDHGVSAQGVLRLLRRLDA